MGQYCHSEHRDPAISKYCLTSVDVVRVWLKVEFIGRVRSKEDV